MADLSSAVNSSSKIVYPYPIGTNAASFVNITLDSKNYRIWEVSLKFLTWEFEHFGNIQREDQVSI